MIPRPYFALGLVLALIATHLAVGVKSYEGGVRAEAARWQAEALKDAQEAAQEREALQQQLREREAKWVQQQQEAADAVAQVRVEYLPGKTVVKREIVREPVYRTCVVSPGMRDTLNAALRGRPVPGAADIGTDTGRLPGDA